MMLMERDQVMLLLRNENSCHVLRKVLTLFNPIDFKNPDLDQIEVRVRMLEYFADMLQGDYVFLSSCNHKFGVIVIKELVQTFKWSRIYPMHLEKLDDQDLLALYDQYSQIKLRFYRMIVKHFIVLSQNCYGNYITQELLDQPQNLPLPQCLQS